MVWKLVVPYLAVAVALSLAARMGIFGVVVFGGLAIVFAAILRKGRWFTPWPYVVGFWLLPCVPTLLLVYRNWTRTERARPGSRVHRSDARVVARPVVPFVAALAWLASRPPHSEGMVYDRTVSAILAAVAVLTGGLLVVLDLFDLLITRSRARDAARGGPLEDRSHEGVPVFDFGVGDAMGERLETTGEGYRGTTRSVAVYHGRGVEAVSMLARSAAWSAATVAVAVVAAIEVVRQALMGPG